MIERALRNVMPGQAMPSAGTDKPFWLTSFRPHAATQEDINPLSKL